jgi:hypothetical protein
MHTKLTIVLKSSRSAQNLSCFPESYKQQANKPRETNVETIEELTDTKEESRQRGFRHFKPEQICHLAAA